MADKNSQAVWTQKASEEVNRILEECGTDKVQESREEIDRLFPSIPNPKDPWALMAFQALQLKALARLVEQQDGLITAMLEERAGRAA